MSHKEFRDYHCGFCKNDFQAKAGTGLGSGGEKQSNQIICPKCGNFLKTWSDKKWI